MRIDRNEAHRIALLARIEMGEAELERMSAEMSAILTYIDQLQEADPGVVESEATAATPLRDDEPHTPLDRDQIAKNAPEWRDGFFVVPRVIGGE